MKGRGSRVRGAALWLALTAVVLMISATAPSIGASASADGGRYFPETGHALDTVFESFYDGYGGEAILGYPITESFVDPYSGFLVQYFENARLELAPNSVGDLEVRLTGLGVLLGGWDLPLEESRFPIGNNPGCRYYAQSGHQVCHAFLDFYETNGGPVVFGAPVTEFRFENGRMVQYFRDFRLDWYPESQEGERIRVAPLGREHFNLMGYEPYLLEPIVPGYLEDYPVLDIRLSSSVLKPLIGTDEAQQVYLVVSDQNRQPVPGAAALLTIYYPDGIRFRMMPITDANGVTQIDISLQGSIPGSRVALEYTVVYGSLSALTRDSFYVWY
ncbi:MAG: hypothetical protein BMS9Abin28_1152 [Anaerolineae bacterium]|nr:MAG: hypothetical protein BMS9Abin28_1152 [Anaerolineae bacterium]